jgi:hypothetical protein
VGKANASRIENFTKVAQAEFVAQPKKQNLEDNFGGDL